MLNMGGTQPAHTVNPSEHIILLVDDKPVNLAVLARHLASCGFQIQVAQTGEAGLGIARVDTLPDLILLDIMLPGMNGLGMPAVKSG